MYPPAKAVSDVPSNPFPQFEPPFRLDYDKRRILDQEGRFFLGWGFNWPFDALSWEKTAQEVLLMLNKANGSYDEDTMPVGVGIIITDAARMGCWVSTRKDNITYPGYLQVPGGGAEQDELRRDAAARELFEETGLVRQADEELNYVTHLPVQRDDGSYYMSIHYTTILREGERLELKEPHKSSEWTYMLFSEMQWQEKMMRGTRAALMQMIRDYQPHLL